MNPKLVIRSLKGKALAIDPTRPLLGQLHGAGLDWMHACGARGRCTTCRLRLLNSEATFSVLTPPEERYRAQGRLRPDERLTCQARLLGGTAEVTVPHPCRFPHISYSD